MKTQKLATLTAAAVATTAVFGVTGAAQAYSFGSGGISFTKDTTVTFTMGRSHGSYISSLGIYEVNGSTPSKVYDLFWETKKSDNGNASGWMGTFGNTLTSATGSAVVTYKFLANKVYTLGLTSIEAIRGRAPRLVGTVFSTTSLNGAFGQGAVFSSTGTNGISNDGGFFDSYGARQTVNPAEFNDLTKGAAISFDDGGNKADKDYNDFAFTAAVPEPLTMGGMLLGAAGMAIARKRRNNIA
ncbi:MAG: hypothetical protein Fur0025_16540 [Oscillatoriaceae cyanobacterium]